VLRELLRDIRDRSDIGVPTPNYVLVTGDIASTGGKDAGEYESAREFLDQLLLELDLERDRVLVVPGNHDLVRARSGPFREKLEALRKGDDIAGVLEDRRSRSSLSRRFESFLRFQAEYGPTPVLQNEFGFRVWELDPSPSGVPVRAMGINTALLSQTADEQGKLQVGVQLFSEALEEATVGKPEPIVICLAHHPPGWLRDSQYVELLLRRHVSILAHGHLHIPRQEKLHRSARDEYIRVQAGATYRPIDEGSPSWERDGGHAYSFITLEESDEGRPRMVSFPRRWVEENQEFDRDELLAARNRHCSDALHLRIGGFREQERPDASLHAASESPAAFIRQWSHQKLQSFGERTTAFAFDPTIAEQWRLGIVLPPRMDRYRGRGVVERGDLGVGELAGLLAKGQSALLMGELGAGKTVALLGVAESLRSRRCLPIVLSPDDFIALGGRPIFRAHREAVRKVAAEKHHRIVMVVDGVDEYLASGLDPEGMREACEQLPEQVAVCFGIRTAVYESAVGPDWDELFPVALVLRNWTPRRFGSYLTRLDEAGLGYPPAHLRLRLREGLLPEHLTARPLSARLLASLSSEDLDQVKTETDLYSRIIASSEALALARRPNRPRGEPTPGETWRVMASRIRRQGLMIGDSFNVEEALSAHGKVMDSERLARHDLALLGELRGVPPDETCRFVHYSIYEYLAGSAFAGAALGVARRRKEGQASLVIELGTDLTRSMRHYAADELREHWSAELSKVLTEAYSSELLPQTLGSQGARSARNLIAYFLSRACRDAQMRLRRLVEAERDPYLICSLMWGLAHLGDGEMTSSFMRRLDESNEMRSLARGQTLQYYGDMPDDDGPPFEDRLEVQPAGSVDGVVAMIASPRYTETIPSTRWAVDLYVLYDLLVSRSLTLSARQERVCRRVLRSLALSGLEDWVGNRLIALHAVASEPRGRRG
jgi:hypothetical protein